MTSDKNMYCEKCGAIIYPLPKATKPYLLTEVLNGKCICCMYEEKQKEIDYELDLMIERGRNA